MTWLHEFETRHGPTVRAVERALGRVEAIFTRAIGSDLECVRELCARVERYRGKMLRPAMTVLSGLAAAPEPDEDRAERLARLAAVVEMIHVATLVHDDVLDEANVRRQRPTIRALRGNEAAVILGDYLISVAFHLCSSLEDQTVALRIGDVTSRVCSGELLQLSHRQSVALDEQTYREIIERKTASLIGVACEQGARLAGGPVEAQRALREFGVRLGVAFQIQDDLLDLVGDEAVVGKSVGKDLEKGKLTLPVIHHLAVAEPDRRRASLALMRAAWTGEALHGPAPGSVAGTATLVDARRELRLALDETGSLEYAADAADRSLGCAKAALAGLPESGAVALLHELAEATAGRQR